MSTDSHPQPEESLDPQPEESLASYALGVVSRQLEHGAQRSLGRTNKTKHEELAAATINKLNSYTHASTQKFLEDKEKKSLATVNYGMQTQKRQIDKVDVENLDCDCSFILEFETHVVESQQRIVRNATTKRWSIAFYDRPRTTKEEHIVGCPERCLLTKFGSAYIEDLDRLSGASIAGNWVGRSRFVNQLLPICELLRSAKVHILGFPNPLDTSVINPGKIHLHCERNLSPEDDAEYEQWSVQFRAGDNTPQAEVVNFEVQLPHDNLEPRLLPRLKLGAWNQAPGERNLEQYVRWLYDMFKENEGYKIPVICGYHSDHLQYSPLCGMNCKREIVRATLKFIQTPDNMKTPLPTPLPTQPLRLLK